METLKNFFKIILLITYLFQKSVNAPPKSDLPFLPDLNEVTDEARKERERCIQNIYTDLKCHRPASSRYEIPKQVFGTINVNSLKNHVTRRYFEHMHDKIIPIAKNLEPKIMPNPEQFCRVVEKRLIHTRIHPTLKDRSCIERLREKFPIVEDLKKILQHTFNTFVASEFLHDNDYVLHYYNKIFLYLGFDDDLMTPFEYCKSLTEDHVISPEINLTKKRRSYNTEESSSSRQPIKAGTFSQRWEFLSNP